METNTEDWEAVNTLYVLLTTMQEFLALWGYESKSSLSIQTHGEVAVTSLKPSPLTPNLRPVNLRLQKGQLLTSMVCECIKQHQFVRYY